MVAIKKVDSLLVVASGTSGPDGAMAVFGKYGNPSKMTELPSIQP
ncbi:MAG: hypothetical protein WCF85_12225 [Rhodospirillaceae bacterium]